MMAVTAYDSSQTVLHDHGLSSSVSATDDHGAPLTYSTTGGPAHGSLTLNPNGSYSYTPNAGYVGSDTFDFIATSSGNDYSGYGGYSGGSDTGTVSISVDNNAPIASDDSTSILHDHSFSSSVSGSDPDGDALTYGFPSSASNGTLTFNSDGSFSYTPNAGFVGTDSFNFLVSDNVASDSGTFTITVYNTAPTADNSSHSVVHDRTLSSSASGYDYDGDSLTFSASGASNGTVSMISNGSYTYTPNVGFVGSDTITFTTGDGIDSTSGLVTIDVTNATPTANSSCENILHDTVLSSSVSGYDSDGDPITFGSAGAGNGAVSMNSNGSYTYTPNLSFVGTDTINFTLSDGTIGSTGTSTGTVTVSVYNTAPTVNSSSETVLHTLTLSSSVSGTDADSDALTFSVVAGHGTVTLNADGTYVYEPDFTYAGPDSFTFKAHDGAEYSSNGTVEITVTYSPPVGADDRYWVIDDTRIVSTPDDGLLANDLYVIFATDSVVIVDYPQHATLTLFSQGAFEVDFDEAYLGLDTFSYQILSPRGNSGVVFVNLVAAELVVTVTTPDGVKTAIPKGDVPTAVPAIYVGENVTFDAKLIGAPAGATLEGDWKANDRRWFKTRVADSNNGNVSFLQPEDLKLPAVALAHPGFAGNTFWTYKGVGDWDGKKTKFEERIFKVTASAPAYQIAVATSDTPFYTGTRGGIGVISYGNVGLDGTVAATAVPGVKFTREDGDGERPAGTTRFVQIGLTDAKTTLANGALSTRYTPDLNPEDELRDFFLDSMVPYPLSTAIEMGATGRPLSC